jgi:hypothetical protein
MITLRIIEILDEKPVRMAVDLPGDLLRDLFMYVLMIFE